jgi:predicted CopG family antitoxin
MKMIKVGDDTYDRLKRHGRFGKFFYDILNRLMYIAGGKLKK